ncbi:hypothetical protein OPT61_g9355 [Boeremia exigua]|uniref:Uncharacterized protein n=1 Tax=Boeremia exigua TaxID=749465 RepID=A0ACC2HUE0_9PLEO|nr:hypothetical protein OPT61_g9355 [Boeremia exigua]
MDAAVGLQFVYFGDGELRDSRGRTILRDDEIVVTVDDHGVLKRRRLHWRRVSGWMRGWAPAVSVAATPSVSRAGTPAHTSPREQSPAGETSRRPGSRGNEQGRQSRSRSQSIPIRTGGRALDEARALLGTSRHASPRSYGALGGSPRSAHPIPKQRSNLLEGQSLRLWKKGTRCMEWDEAEEKEYAKAITDFVCRAAVCSDHCGFAGDHERTSDLIRDLGSSVFLSSFTQALPDLHRRGIKLAINAGASDTEKLYETLLEITKGSNLDLVVVWVEGDKVIDAVRDCRSAGHQFKNITTGQLLDDWGFEPLYAQCYLGC